jgi:hypothetical protein
MSETSLASINYEYHDFGILGYIPRLERLLKIGINTATHINWDFDWDYDYNIPGITININDFCYFAISSSADDEGEEDGGTVAIFHKISKADIVSFDFTEDEKPVDEADNVGFCDHMMTLIQPGLARFKNLRNVKFCISCRDYLGDGEKCECTTYSVPHEETCPICLTNETNRWCMLPCKHEFHHACIQRLKEKKCPLCRTKFDYERRL